MYLSDELWRKYYRPSSRGGSALSPPTGISAVVTATGVTITFTPVSGMETEIYVAIDGGSSTLLTTTGIGVGTYDYVTDEPHDFVFLLRSKQDLTSLSAPTDLAGADTTDGADLTWVDTNSGLYAYRVWADINSGGYAVIATTAAGAESYHHSTTGTSVKYKVEAIEGTLPVRSAFSNEITVTIAASPAAPTNFAVVWGTDDTATMTFTDGSGGSAQHELYESLAGGAYSLVTTLAAGTATYANPTWQNASMAFKMRAKLGSKYSAYTDIVSLVTPLVFKTNQSTPTTVTINPLVVPAGKTVHIDWGNGTNNDYSNFSGAATGTYSVGANPLYVQISGDINSITRFQMASQAKVIGDIGKWIFPTGITANFDLHANGLTGDLTGKIFPPSCPIIDFTFSSFTGDLSGVNIPTVASGNHQFNNTPFTKPARGDYRGCIQVKFNSCNMSTATLESWLAYLNAFFATNTPTRNCTYNISGASNGIIPANNADLLAIVAAYVAAGKTCTITTRTS